MPATDFERACQAGLRTNLLLPIAPITLTRLCNRLGFRAPVLSKRSTHVITFLDASALIAPDISLVPLWGDQLSLRSHVSTPMFMSLNDNAQALILCQYLVKWPAPTLEAQ